jgi:import inner membrane translocase subunit TIM13
MPIPFIESCSISQTITDKCFAKCVQKPGSALDSSENKCLNLCMDRFIDAKQLVARTYLGRVSRESSLS